MRSTLPPPVPRHWSAWIPLLALASGVIPACTTEELGGTGVADSPGQVDDDLGNGNPDPFTPDPTEPQLVDLSFTPDDTDFANPERGYYVGVNLLSGDPDSVRSEGHALAIAEVRLDSWRDSLLPDSLLDQIDAGFARVRQAGIKVVIRFMYNASFGEDASRSWILTHIGQLKPSLQANADVIAVMQAGFIGAWGEWHSSTNGLDNDDDRRAILTAILDALPASRTVQVRTPMHKEGALPGGPLTEEEAFTGSLRARTGHHNDCFLASTSDMGTYQSPVDQWKNYVAADGRFTPIGGETCALNAPRTDCASAVAEMEMAHWSYLNLEYRQEVLDGWETQGCGGEIRRRLGYRFVIESGAVSEMVAPGGILRVAIDVTNIGFAAPFNQRPVFVVLDDGIVRRQARLEAVDVRTWGPGQTVSLRALLRVPADAAAGTYRLTLRLPDEASGLSGDARYAIRMANGNMWDEWTGDNLITDQLVIDPAAPGAVDPTATGLTEIVAQ